MKKHYSSILLFSLTIMLVYLLQVLLHGLPAPAPRKHQVDAHIKSEQMIAPEVAPKDKPTYNQRFGLNNINYIHGETGANARRSLAIDGASRQAKADQIGATWNRWVLWWHLVHERANGCSDFSTDDPYYDPLCQQYGLNGTHLYSPTLEIGCPIGLEEDDPQTEWNWSHPEQPSYDELVSEPFNSLIVLQGVPKCLQVDPRAPSPVPQNLYQPIFIHYQTGQPTENPMLAANGDSGINPQNYWGRFVYEAIKRYGSRVEYWQIWNEPNDFNYWPTHAQDYTRLLEVAYWASQHTQKDIKLVLGGLSDLRQEDPDGLERIIGALQEPLRVIDAPDGEQYMHQCLGTTCDYTTYFDILALHKYIGPWSLFDFAEYLQQVNGLGNKKVWITEAGINTAIMGSDREQLYASYVMQQTVYLLVKGEEYQIEKFFHYGLDNSDDNTGLFISSEHEFHRLQTERPVYRAYRLLNKYLGHPAVQADSPQMLEVPTSTSPNGLISADHQEVYFTTGDHPELYDHITVLWGMADEGQQQEITVRINAKYAGRKALLVWQDDDAEHTLPIELGCDDESDDSLAPAYELSLPPRRHSDIGGRVAILLEDKELTAPCE